MFANSTRYRKCLDDEDAQANRDLAQRRYEELLKTDADYLDLQRRRRTVQASLRRRAKPREQDEWAAGAS